MRPDVVKKGNLGILKVVHSNVESQKTYPVNACRSTARHQGSSCRFSLLKPFTLSLRKIVIFFMNGSFNVM